MPGDIFGCHLWEETMLLASGEERPGMLQATGQPLSQGIIQPNMSIVLRQSEPSVGTETMSA